MRPSHRAAGHTRPVFLDRSGLRRRRVVMAGAAVATALVTGLVVLVVGFFGSSSGHVPGFPGAGAPAATPAPKPSGIAPSASGATQPGLTPTPTTALNPSQAQSSLAPTPTTRRRSPSHPPHPAKSH